LREGLTRPQRLTGLLLLLELQLPLLHLLQHLLRRFHPRLIRRGWRLFRFRGRLVCGIIFRRFRFVRLTWPARVWTVRLLCDCRRIRGSIIGSSFCH
jgi:hypothetical protein